MTTIELYGGPRDGFTLEIPYADEGGQIPLELRLPAFGLADWASIADAADAGVPLVRYQLEKPNRPRACPRYRWEGLSG